MCGIDWALVLEFAKAFAAPTAGVASVLLVSVLGVRTFKSQKAIERRLLWYDTAYSLLDRTAMAYAVAVLGGATDKERAALFEAANQASRDLGDHLGRSWLYADQASHDAVEALGKVMEEVDMAVQQYQRVDGPSALRIGNACHAAALAMASSMRENLGLPQLVAR